MVYNVVFMEEYEEICDLRKPFEVAVGLTSRENYRFASSKATSQCDVSCFICMRTSVA